jgi:hypothetical protein
MLRHETLLHPLIVDSDGINLFVGHHAQPNIIRDTWPHNEGLLSVVPPRQYVRRMWQ